MNEVSIHGSYVFGSNKIVNTDTQNTDRGRLDPREAR